MLTRKQKDTATGFEENFTDSPMTPQEYEEDCELYNS